MNAYEDPEQRTALLEFVERHWRELTLREARSLSVENVEHVMWQSSLIKKSLTLR